MTALLDHIWRLMTFRHDLRGLDTREATTAFAVIGISCAACWLRWQSGSFLVHAFLLFIMMCFGWPQTRFVIGYALISAGIDVTATIVGMVIHDRYFLFGWWELAASLVIFTRGVRSPG